MAGMSSEWSWTFSAFCQRHPLGVARWGGTALLALSLGACAGAQRFDGAGLGSRSLGGGGGPVASVPASQPLPPSEPVVTTPVQTAPLAPPPGAATATAPTAGADPLFERTPQPDPLDTGAPPPAPRVIETPTLSGGAGQVATLGQQPGAGRGPVTSRQGVIGGWTAREATGSSCRVQLSSTPAVDLYRASAAGCSNRDLQKVTAWDLRDGEVYLYQPGGSVAARLRVNDGASLAGVIARSGAALSLSR